MISQKTRRPHIETAHSFGALTPTLAATVLLCYFSLLFMSRSESAKRCNKRGTWPVQQKLNLWFKFGGFPRFSGWWYTYPSEKYESFGIMKFPIHGKIKFMFQTTNQILYDFLAVSLQSTDGKKDEKRQCHLGQWKVEVRPNASGLNW